MKYLKKGEYDQAMKLYTDLIELDPENKSFNSTIYANRALCLQKKKKFVEALSDINKSISLNEKYTKAFLRRGHIHRDLGNFEEARYDYERVKAKEPGNKEVYNLIEQCKVDEKKAKKKDYYKLLEIERSATPQDIKKAYRKLAPKYHPDKNNESPEASKNAEKMFRDVSEAYQVLSDPQKKRMYDSGVNPDEPGFGFGGGGGGIDPTEIFNMFFGGGGGFGGGGEPEEEGNPFGFGGFGGNSRGQGQSNGFPGFSFSNLFNGFQNPSNGGGSNRSTGGAGNNRNAGSSGGFGGFPFWAAGGTNPNSGAGQNPFEFFQKSNTKKK